jgi:ketosteroid isomerase-like protein
VSQEYEQIVRRGFDLWNRKDFESLAGIFHPDLEIDATNGC